jgi:hypothetical protein
MKSYIAWGCGLNSAMRCGRELTEVKIQQKERRAEMAKVNVPASEWMDIARQMKGNPAMRVRLAELIRTGQVDISIDDSGNLRVMADAVPATSTPPSSALTSAMKPARTIDSRTAYKAIAEIAGSREGKIALQKRATGQTLSPGETRLLERHDALMAANEEQARKERPKLPGKYSTQPEFASRLVRGIVAERDGFTRVNDARQAIAEIRANKDHARV